MLKAPFPWFGGKSRVADLVWERFGVVDNYVEPFAGSLACLLGAPRVHRTETVNDIDGLICNFWRAVGAAPDAVAEHCDWPVNENDLHARHAWLLGEIETLTRRLEGDPEFFDAKIAGWWCWGISLWIGSGFCSGNGSWRVVDGQLVHLGDAGRGVHRQLVHLHAGRGVHRKLVHLGDAGRGVHRQRVHLGDAGRGVHRQRVHLGDAGQGDVEDGLRSWFQALSDRLRRVRVCCGDWERVCGETPTTKQGTTAVFLDPPYGETRCPDLYRKDSTSLLHRVADWCRERGNDSGMRIALCGYDGEHFLEGWSVEEWSASGGYASQGSAVDVNRHRERIWFSPHCLSARQGSLF